MNSLIQGLLLTALVMVPAIVFHLVAFLRNTSVSSGYKSPGASVLSSAIENKQIENAFRATSSPMPLAFENTGQSSTETYPSYQESNESSHSIVLGSDENRPTPATPEVAEQLSQVSKFVQSHDIGGDINLEDESVIPVVDKPIRDVPQSVLNQSIDISDSTELSAMSTQQISSLVTSLKEEKGKLQKLVIAQHAVIESEREANVRNRGLARDAIKLMHGARKNQKMAEKMARRERTERQRLELEYKKVSVALNNAMSIISSRQGSPNPVGGH